MKNSAFIALGSNIEDRYTYLKKAVLELDSFDEIKVVSTSSIYETDPVGYEDQDKFLNMVIKVNTSLGPFELLDTCLDIEQKLGRKREIKWGPRTIDLDILLYNNENIETENLTVPHPRMKERAFVMIPLMEIRNSTLPVMKKPFDPLLETIANKEGVRIWKQKNGEDVFALFEN
ncbi:2-amino-4-hydroxy-6-hydroxymethyldihydropteridine diphosphokinase [Bacillus methanolicus]|uniref:2-amino-4-hydroxy-6-hydroxymethyldihydropteridine diphosphokinase n=1 Tax=Bacillus methanolicus (strain MGA3 / ATCC 53907) TaxID=796606 RepID=I3EC63_BACMM|nr:2-amino-4-hydroxy-6-hydroxymethyldihydropteridine diphosphokinase [Bacillus methanolicus]AIE58606.1 2-amino-4-hydroxy-6-hydroxymethyldihydropteridine pyrophosphokinase [Bacillus methanolicus MGA3]EIJ84084.1 2-amino-4-hydroxy-6-hydroxymethyldihydropteridine pyrophosphokinase [Bacillus methanolicus MGA3]